MIIINNNNKNIPKIMFVISHDDSVSLSVVAGHVYKIEFLQFVVLVVLELE